MTNQEIKNEVDHAYDRIAHYEEQLKYLREICPHEKTYIGNYSWRVGSFELAVICEYCGAYIESFNETEVY